MISEAIDGLLPTLRKNKILNNRAVYSRDGIQFMEMGNCLIRYRVVGSGSKTLVFETDPPVVIEHYDELVGLLKNDYKIVIFEPPGFGFSVPSMTLDYGFKSVVSITEQFLERLALGPYVFNAPCVLGYGALGLAQKRPDLIEKIVLMQVPSWTEMLKWKQGRDPQGILATPVIGQLLLQMLKRKRTPQWFEASLGSMKLHPHFNQIAQEAFKHGASFNLASGFQQYLSGSSPLTHKVQQPSLIIWGDLDPSHCITCKASTSIMVEDAQVIHINESGHFPELETPDIFCGHLVNFLETQEHVAVHGEH
ncbi:MAG: alpha/beta hydrolase [Bermanella sp.]